MKKLLLLLVVSLSLISCDGNLNIAGGPGFSGGGPTCEDLFGDNHFVYLRIGSDCESEIKNIKISLEEFNRLKEIVSNTSDSCIFATVNPEDNSDPIEGYIKKQTDGQSFCPDNFVGWGY